MKNHDGIVFVYGALRSGTTVFRLMLDAHPQLSNPGEMDFLFDWLSIDDTHPTGWRYDLEGLQSDRIFNVFNLKITPGLEGLDLLDSFLEQLKACAQGKILSINLHRHVDRVVAILPKTRILHMLRDPRDVARSSIQMGWAGTLYHGVEHWVNTEKAWDHAVQSVDPSQILEITYEALFRDIETTLQSVCSFFRIPYEPDMLRYHETTTYGPPDVALTEQWKRKCIPDELAELEAYAEPLMTRRGYPPSQPAIHLGKSRKLKLAVHNKLSQWRYGMNYYGARMYWAEKVTRRCGLKTSHQNIRSSMHAIANKRVK